MFKSTIVAILSLSMAFSAYAVPIPIPFTGLTADILVERNSPIPHLVARVNKATGH